MAIVFPNVMAKVAGDPKRALRDWDLWGPMLVSIGLTLALCARSADPARVFAVVFAILAGGAVVITVNVWLLAGKIAFFQSVSLLVSAGTGGGYALACLLCVCVCWP